MFDRNAGSASSVERCESGRFGRSRKPLSSQGDRGFKSHPLRQTRGVRYCISSPFDRRAGPRGSGIGYPACLIEMLVPQARGERWPSGRRRGIGNAVYGKPYRGFKSRPLRQFRSLGSSRLSGLSGSISNERTNKTNQIDQTNRRKGPGPVQKKPLNPARSGRKQR